MKSPTPEELTESEIATGHAPETSGRQAAVTALLLLAGIVLLAFVRPRLAGTIGVLAAIIAMIMLHELGHFVMAKRAGMKVTEFFLGFGPRLWSFRKGETEYGVKAIPAGGYVRIIGMSNVDEVDPADEERTYRAKPYRHRLGVAVAGSTMHFLIATLLLLTVYAAVGIPSARPVIEQIVPDSPAQHSDFRVGDRIVAVNGTAVKTWEDIPTYVQAHGESQLVFTVIHKGTNERADVSLKPRAETVDGKLVPRVGIGPEQYLQTKPIPSAISTTLTEMPKFMWQT
ncbi:MAG TPA: site-2 protease family protein, partial [Acidimicrobiia bacterium]|nr:site-2 protease family protein [Acidimicrobiia bacterium]